MSTPVEQLPPPPPAVTQQAFTRHSDNGSIGPVIGVLAVITILGILAGVIGRLCSGRPVFGYGLQFDLEGWVERKCASCIDGTVGPPPPRPVEDVPVPAPVQEDPEPEIVEEEEEEEEEEEYQGNHHGNNEN